MAFVKTQALVIACLVLLISSICYAHGLEHTISREGKCVVISLFMDGGAKFSHKAYEIYNSKDNILFQKGMTDALGRILFCPDREGVWVVKTFSKDGHGSVIKITTTEASLTDTEKNFFDRHEGLLIGAFIIIGLFGILELVIAKWPKKQS